eukprot:scaffold1211_cov169-Amphora_coffeaeformis.AAC.8
MEVQQGTRHKQNTAAAATGCFYELLRRSSRFSHHDGFMRKITTQNYGTIRYPTTWSLCDERRRPLW